MWDYQAVTMKYESPAQLESKLNEIGALGWELVAMTRAAEYDKREFLYIFKRPRKK